MVDFRPIPLHPRSPPVHVAIIMDGNGRWAKARGLPRAAGHRRGAESVRVVIRAAADMGVRYLTLFGFSSENWRRPSGEVNDLMGLLRLYLRNEVGELHRNGVRLRIIGDRERLPQDIASLVEEAERLTGSNVGLTVTVALSYGGRQELVRAARLLAEEAAAGRLRPEEIDERALVERLFTADMPDPDLLIRTSGEKRISNFLLWQSAYTELVFTETLWPDFDRTDLEAALGEFHLRERRYGAVSS
ncbi:MAG: isoprenyl transferase [Alphaproteobacteria bacterium]|nr:isoprenyl transferase [Alphaproteobacteria bacterium]MBF0130855.1 isoprenyl transferase [Alphaproteobacteria bacterium]